MARDSGSPDQGASPTDGESLCQCLWRTKSWRLLALLLAYMSGLMLLVPVLPTLMTNDFASRRAGEETHCEDFTPTKAPPACQDAHSDVVFFSTWSGFAQNTLLSVVLTPAVSAWSDIHGRKPFLLLAQGLNLVPLTLVLLNVKTGLPLTWYYVATAFTGSLNSITPSLTYMADVAPPHLRAACFGLIMAVFSVAIMVGPAVGALMPAGAAPAAAIAVTVGCMAAAAALLPESLPAATANEARMHQRLRQHDSEGNPPSRPAAALAATWRALTILRRSPLFRRLTLVLMVGAVVSEGLQDLLIQYLQLKIGFGPGDTAQVFMVYGACALVIQGLLLRPMLGALGERRLLVLGLTASAVQQVALGLATGKSAALAAIAVGSFSSLTFPTVSAIKANNAGDHEQGSVQGALYGARALASGFGPLAFAALFAGFTHTDSPLPYFPGAPFMLGAALMVAAAGIAAGLPADAGGSAGWLFAKGRGGVGAAGQGALHADEGSEGGSSGGEGTPEAKRLLDGAADEDPRQGARVVEAGGVKQERPLPPPLPMALP